MLSNLSSKIYFLVTEWLHDLKKDQTGVTTIEYGLIVFVIGLFLIAMLYSPNSFIVKLSDKLAVLSDTISDAVVDK